MTSSIKMIKKLVSLFFMAIGGYILFIIMKIVFIYTLPLSMVDNREIILNKTLPVDNLSETRIRHNILLNSEPYLTDLILFFVFHKSTMGIGEREEVLVELDKNETTYEILTFSENIDPSLENFYNIGIVQYRAGEKAKLLFFDINCTYPLIINIDKDNKWASLKSEHSNGLIKEWIFLSGWYYSKDKEWAFQPIKEE